MVYITIRNQRVATGALQVVTNKLNVYAAGIGLTFSTRKTVSMIFRKRRKRNEEPMEITLRNPILHFKEVTQFLGIILN